MITVRIRTAYTERFGTLPSEAESWDCAIAQTGGDTLTWRYSVRRGDGWLIALGYTAGKRRDAEFECALAIYKHFHPAKEAA